jgi:hypothetical protein
VSPYALLSLLGPLAFSDFCIFSQKLKKTAGGKGADGDVFGAVEENEFDAGNRQLGSEVIELIVKWSDLGSHRGDLLELMLGCPTKEGFANGGIPGTFNFDGVRPCAWRQRWVAGS